MLNSIDACLRRLPDMGKVQGVSSAEDHVVEAEDNMRVKRNRPSPTQAESSKACRIFTAETRVAESAAGRGSQVCRHMCVHHPEMIDPGLWSKLSEDLVGLIFARLPITHIIELRRSSTAWSAISDSSSFKRSFAEANRHLFGFLGWDNDLEIFLITHMLDAKSKQWHGVELTFPVWSHDIDSWYACDGGLVCFVPEVEDEEEDSGGPYLVYVCNPLTNTWKALPEFPFHKKELVLLQLVTDVDANSYRVVLVCREKNEKEQALGADVYDSQTGAWSAMDFGFVFGSRSTFLGDISEPSVFDCATKTLFYLDDRPPLDALTAARYSFVKDRLFVLHAVVAAPNEVPHSSEMFVISEYAWQSSTSELRKLKDYEGVLSGIQTSSYIGRLDMELFTSTGFILSLWDDVNENGSLSQLIRLYDMSAEEWHTLPTLVGKSITQNEKLEGVFMCELRWDAIP